MLIVSSIFYVWLFVCFFVCFFVLNSLTYPRLAVNPLFCWGWLIFFLSSYSDCWDYEHVHLLLFGALRTPGKPLLTELCPQHWPWILSGSYLQRYLLILIQKHTFKLPGFFKRMFVFYVMRVGILPACMPIDMGPPELELWTVVSCHVVSGNLNLSPLEEQPVLPNAKPFPPCPKLCILNWYLIKFQEVPMDLPVYRLSWSPELLSETWFRSLGLTT